MLLASASTSHDPDDIINSAMCLLDQENLNEVQHEYQWCDAFGTGIIVL